MYRLSKNKLSFPMTESIRFRGATSLYWQNKNGTLSCYTICPYKGRYLLDRGIIESYNPKAVGMSHWRGFTGYYRTWVSHTLPVFKIENIPFLEKVSSNTVRDKLKFLLLEGQKLYANNSSFTAWEYIYDKFPVQPFKDTAEWVLNNDLHKILRVDHGARNFLFFKGELLWNDPFFDNKILGVITLRR